MLRYTLKRTDANTMPEARRHTPAAALRYHAGFPAVMAIGIVSIVAQEVGHHALSIALGALAAAVYVVVAPAWGDIWRRRRATPESFAAVAATAVLGTRVALANVVVFPDVVLALAAVAWAGMWVGLRRARDLGAPTGSRLLLVVSTQSLVVLGSFSAHRLAPLELALFVLGLVLYPVVLARIPLREWRASGGDVWIEMGALAISTLAAARMSHLIAHHVLRDLALALWICATCFVPPLVVAELRWPRIHFHAKRWGTVFPLGMYGAATVAVAHAGSIREPTLARAALWSAVTVGTLTGIGAMRAALRSTA